MILRIHKQCERSRVAQAERQHSLLGSGRNYGALFRVGLQARLRITCNFAVALG
ncbi:MAG: virulence promoting factor [Candidatus Aenigmarchaeota archaeon]|nr:virulence promoting factor [Candidatus Aenigmarchaeota archaeon]